MWAGGGFGCGGGGGLWNGGLGISGIGGLGISGIAGYCVLERNTAKALEGRVDDRLGTCEHSRNQVSLPAGVRPSATNGHGTLSVMYGRAATGRSRLINSNLRNRMSLVLLTGLRHAYVRLESKFPRLYMYNTMSQGRYLSINTESSTGQRSASGASIAASAILSPNSASAVRIVARAPERICGQNRILYFQSQCPRENGSKVEADNNFTAFDGAILLNFQYLLPVSYIGPENRIKFCL